MKLEKISDNQIRCTLNKDDLVDRQLRLSELTYGSEKAKALFKEMMQQASQEFGFEADDIPLMIEAIPVSSECLILVITKVEDPDELDTRFSKFSADQDKDSDSSDNTDEYVDEIINCFDQINEILEDKKSSKNKTVNTPYDSDTSVEKDNKKVSSDKQISCSQELTKVFSFHSLGEITNLASHLQHNYDGLNSVYKNPMTGIYYLTVSKSDHTPEEFNKICNTISEYGKIERTTYASIEYYKEHLTCIVPNDAINILANI